VLLETARLRIRPFHPDLSDLPAMLQVLGDPASMRFYPRPFDEADVRSWIERSIRSCADVGLGLLAIEERSSGEVVGDAGPSVQEVHGEPFVELGWHVRRDRQGRGIATEAGAACLEHLRTARADIDVVISLIRPENVPSWKVASRLGFTPWRGTVRAGMAHVVWRLDPRAPRDIEAGARASAL
jgi:RimJ/RimL family protein N-acetyltransferase